MNSFLKIIVSSSVIIFIFVLYFSENIKGYYSFKQYCEKEGGLQIFQPIKKNVGWLAKDKYEAELTLNLDNVAFVRFWDGDRQYDLKPVGKRNVLNPESEVLDVDLTVSPVYELENVNYSPVSAYATGKVMYQVKKLSDGRVMVRFTAFYYQFFDSNRTPMGANEKFSCFDDTVDAYYRRWNFEIDNSFID